MGSSGIGHAARAAGRSIRVRISAPAKGKRPRRHTFGSWRRGKPETLRWSYLDRSPLTTRYRWSHWSTTPGSLRRWLLLPSESCRSSSTWMTRKGTRCLLFSRDVLLGRSLRGVPTLLVRFATDVVTEFLSSPSPGTRCECARAAGSRSHRLLPPGASRCRVRNQRGSSAGPASSYVS